MRDINISLLQIECLLSLNLLFSLHLYRLTIGEILLNTGYKNLLLVIFLYLSGRRKVLYPYIFLVFTSISYNLTPLNNIYQTYFYL